MNYNMLRYASRSCKYIIQYSPFKYATKILHIIIGTYQLQAIVFDV